MFTEDLTVFFADFGQPATVNGNPITVIFSRASQLALGDYVQDAGTQCLAISTDVPAGLPESLAVVIDAVTYKVTAIEPDGTGITVLQLRK